MVNTGQLADSCVLWGGFDTSITARSYAQLNSFLAGFAFVVITLVLDRAHRRRVDGQSTDDREVEHENLVGIALVCGFLGLILTALRYSLLAGERDCALTGGRASSAGVLAAVSFGASMYVLLYAIVQFIAGMAGAVARHCVFIQAVLVPPITVFFVEAELMHLAVALGDTETQQPLQPLWDWANRLAILLPLAVAVACAPAWWAGIRRRRSQLPANRLARTVRTFVPYISVGVVGAVLFRSVLGLPATNPDARISPTEAWLWIALFTAAVLVQSTALSLQKGVEVPIGGYPEKATV